MEHSPYLNQNRPIEALQNLLREHERQKAHEIHQLKTNSAVRRIPVNPHILAHLANVA